MKINKQFVVLIFLFIALGFNPLKSQGDFFPASIPGISLWLTGDSIQFTTLPKIGKIFDHSPFFNDASQVALSEQPTLSSKTLNGHKIIYFDGIDDYLLFNSAISDIRTVFWIVKEDSLATINFRSLLGYSSAYTFLRGGNKELWYSGLTNNAITSGVTKLNTFPINGSTTVLPAKYVMISLVTTGNVIADNFSNDRISDRLWQGNFAELIIYNRALSSLQVDSVEQYLRNKYSPPINLGPDTIVCSSGFPFTLVAKKDYLESYLWQNGSSVDSLTIFTPGAYHIQTQDLFGNTSRDTIQIIEDSMTPLLLSDTSFCPGGSLVWNTGLNKSEYTLVWQNATTDSLINISSPGLYFANITKLSTGCSMTTDTAVVSIDNFSTTATLGPDVSICAGNPIYLISGAAPGNSLIWSGVGSGTGDSIFVTTSGDYIVNATNSNGCLKTDTINVNILGLAPTASFTFDTVCLGGANSFFSTSTPPAGDSIISSIWNFDDLTPTANELSPTHLYADTGAYAVSLTVTTGGGCSSTMIQNIKVSPYPQGTYTATDFCEKDTVKFASTVADFGYPVTYTWDFGDVSSGINNNSIVPNPKHVFTNPGSHSVLLTLQNAFGCATVISNPVTIDSLPIIDFSTSAICENELVQFTDNSVIPKSAIISGGSWNFDDFSPVSTQINPSHTFGFSKWYNIKRIVSLSNGCKDSITKATFVNPQPQALYSVGNVCAETPAIFKDSSSIGGGGTITNWRWDYGNGLTSTLQNDTQTFVNGLLPIVELLVTSDQGCKDSVSSIITVRPLPNTSYSLSAASGGPPLEVEFTNLSTGANSYNWDFGDLTTSNQTNTSNTYSAVGDYSVVLTAQSSFGCMDTSLRIVRVVEAIWDVAVQNVSTILQNNYLSVLAQYVNKGNVDVTNLELTININDGTGLKENWTGLLARGGVLQDTISTSIYMKDSKHFVCVEAWKPNGFSDEVPLDNQDCVAIDRSTFEVLQPYPVPVSDDMITLPILIPSEKNIEINIVDNKGALLKNVYSGNISEGLQLILINTTGMTKGFYAFMVVYEGETVVKKFIID